jgi:hypothetical protein
MGCSSHGHSAASCVYMYVCIYIYKAKQSRYTPWRRFGGERRYSSYSFSTSALDGVNGQHHTPAALLPPGERTPGTHCTGVWVDPRAGLDTEARGKILLPRRGSNPDHPVFQPVVRHYTAWANPAPIYIYICMCVCVCVYKIQNHNSTSCFVWVWNLVSHAKGRA